MQLIHEQTSGKHWLMTYAYTDIWLFSKVSCVCAAASGRLGSRCDRWHLCCCQQQVQTDGLWLCKVCACSHLCDDIVANMMRRKLWHVCFCVYVLQRLFVVHVVCVSSVRTCQSVFAKTYLVCACVICQVGRNFFSSLFPALLLPSYSVVCTSMKPQISIQHFFLNCSF